VAAAAAAREVVARAAEQRRRASEVPQDTGGGDTGGWNTGGWNIGGGYTGGGDSGGGPVARLEVVSEEGEGEDVIPAGGGRVGARPDFSRGFGLESGVGASGVSGRRNDRRALSAGARNRSDASNPDIDASNPDIDASNPDIDASNPEIDVYPEPTAPSDVASLAGGAAALRDRGAALAQDRPFGQFAPTASRPLAHGEAIQGAGAMNLTQREAVKGADAMNVAQRVVRGEGGGATSELLGQAATLSAEELTRLCLEAIRG